MTEADERPEPDEVAESTGNDGSQPVSPVTPPPAPDYNQAGVPSLDYVRDVIETRFGTSLGATELAGETAEAKSLDEQMAEREQAGKDRIEEIRRSLRGGRSS
jgi:hypothetical protein